MSQPMLNRLVFAGEAIVDLLMWVPALPERGGDMLAESAAIEVGGGFNIMAAAVRQGLPVVYAGGHGTGPWGDRVRAALAAEGIRLLRKPDQDADTGFDVALVEAGGERTFVTALGAESLREPSAWDLVRVRPGDAVYVSGYGLVSPGSGRVLGAWAASLPPGVLLFVDPGPLAADIPATVLDPVLARCDWWSCNQREGALLTGSGDPAEAARRLVRRPGDGARPLAEPHRGARRDGGRHYRRRRRSLRSVPGRPGRRAGRGRGRPAGQRGRRPDRHPGRGGYLTHPGRTRPVPRRLGSEGRPP